MEKLDTPNIVTDCGYRSCKNMLDPLHFNAGENEYFLIQRYN